MAERSKAVHLSCILFGGVGSNPTSAKYFFYILYFILFYFIKKKKKKKKYYNRDGIRTRNRQIRSLARYPIAPHGQK